MLAFQRQADCANNDMARQWSSELVAYVAMLGTYGKRGDYVLVFFPDFPNLRVKVPLTRTTRRARSDYLIHSRHCSLGLSHRHEEVYFPEVPSRTD
jgi:hypothetical protein